MVLRGRGTIRKVCGQPHLWLTQNPRIGHEMQSRRSLFVPLFEDEDGNRGEEKLVKLHNMKEDCNAEDSS